ncbi:hypothetical protein Fmac_010425 [Flemingia macrophylla]|uniref:Uncharacterized protein n=1 Tax=Flemingia macrophylla TaxID=520843 RepID=A0ABD1MJJ6_9FABA
MKNPELSNTVYELQERSRIYCSQLTEDSRLAAERIQSLESEAETLISKKKEQTIRQYDQMVRNKQQELSRHLKEISLRNGQASDGIKRKYESEKIEILKMEKDKVRYDILAFVACNFP